MVITLDATPLLGRRTGIGRYVERLVTHLPAALASVGGDDLRVTTWTWRGGRVADLPAGVRQVGPRVPARLLRAAWSRTGVPVAELLVGRTDIVHGTNFVVPPVRRAAAVVTVHDLTYEYHRDTVGADALGYRRLVGRALARGAHVVTPTHAVAAQVIEHYALPPDRVTVTPLGVDESWGRAVPLPAARLDERGLPRDYLVFVGGLDPRKNLPRLVAAHAALRASDPSTPALVLAGPAGRESALTGPGIHVTGWLDDAELRSLVAGARALVLPSLDEGFGLPALEALAAGRPVVAADIPVLREVTGPHAVLADPRDVDAITDALVVVLAAPDDADAVAARRAWAGRFTWERCAIETVAAYRAAASGRAAT